MAETNDQDVRALYVSVWRNRPDQMLELLAKGTPINHIYANGRGLVHVAAWFNHCELLQTLISKGAKIDDVDELGATPLLLAIRNNSFACFKSLAQQRSKSHDNRLLLNIPQGAPLVSPLHALVEEGLLDWLVWAKHHNLIEDINIKNPQGETLAHVAHRKNQWKIFHMLVASGMDLELTNDRGVSIKDLINSRGHRKKNAIKPLKMIEPSPDVV